MFGPKHVWGLDVGRFGLKAVKVAKSGDRLAVLAAEMFEYDWGSVGEEVGSEVVLSAIQEFSAKYPLAKSDRVWVSMPGQAVFSRFINLPPVEQKRIPEIVRYEARQQIPFSIDDVIWGYQPVKDEQLPGEEIEIGLFAIRREIVLDFLANLSSVQHHLYGVQIAPLALYNFFRADQQPREPTVIVDVGAENTDLVIIEGPKFWTRNLPVAGNDITRAIREKFDISFEEAENVKRMAAQSKHARQVFEVMEPVLRDLVSEVQRTIGYYKSLAKEVKFSEVVLLGNAFLLPGMEKFLRDNLQYRVRTLDKTQTLNFDSGVSEDEFKRNLLTFVPALGLAVQGLGLSHMRINLLPPEFEQAREIRRKKPLAIASAACFLLTVACGFVRENSRKALLETYQDQGVGIVKRAEGLDREYKGARGGREDASRPALQLATVGRLPELGYERRFWFDFLKKFFDEKEGCIPREVYLKYFIVMRGGGKQLKAGALMGPSRRSEEGDALRCYLEGTCSKDDQFIHREVRDKIAAFKPLETLKSAVTKDVKYLEDTPQPIQIELASGEVVSGLRFVITFQFKTFDEAMVPSEGGEGEGGGGGGDDHEEDMPE